MVIYVEKWKTAAKLGLSKGDLEEEDEKKNYNFTPTLISNKKIA